MIEYELIDAISTYIVQSQNSLATYLTVTSGYLIVAYLAGAKLTQSQVLIVSALFLFSAAMSTASGMASLSRAIVFVGELRVARPNDVVFLGPSGIVVSATFMLAGVCASLKFMWDVRHPKAD